MVFHFCVLLNGSVLRCVSYIDFILFFYPCSQYNIFVEDIMVTKVKFISSQSTYGEVKHLLDSTSLKSIPLVDSKGMLIMYLCRIVEIEL